MQEGIELEEAALLRYVSKLHVAVVLAKWTNWVLHLPHQLFPIVRDDVTVLNCLQVVKIILTHMDFQIAYILFRSCNSEQSLFL